MILDANFKEVDHKLDADFGTVFALGGGGGSIKVDQTYNPESKNAQSGKAVAEALETIQGGGSGGIVDQTYNSESKNAQSGKAVAEAIEGLRQEIGDLIYTPISINTFTVSPSTAEIGSKVSTVTFNWELNKSAETVTLGGTSLSTAISGSKKLINQNFTTDQQWTLQAIDEKGATSQKTVKLSFLKGIYYGIVSANAEITNDLIKGLSKTLQSGNINRSFTVTPTANQKIVFALPTSDYNDPVFKIGGFEYEWEKVKTFSFTNASGHTESYTVWRSVQAVADTLSITVTATKK